MDDIFILPEPPTKVSTLPPIVLGTIGKGYNPRQLLMNMINGVSTIKYSVLTSDVFEPTRLPNGSNRNTTLLLKTIGYSDLLNPKIVHYNRIHTSTFGIINIPKNNATLVSHLLDAINIIYNTFIYSSDIIDKQLPAADRSGNVQFTLEFISTSFQFYSGLEVILTTDQSGLNLTKADVGLGMVDNTPDLTKLVSIPQATAIALSSQNVYDELHVHIHEELAVIEASTANSTQTWGSTDW